MIEILKAMEKDLNLDQIIQIMKILKEKNRQLFETNKIKIDVLKSEKIIGLN